MKKSTRVMVLVLASILVVYAAVRLHDLGRPGAKPVPVVTTVQSNATPDPSKDPVYVCPMDPDVRSHAPGSCTRCGMRLVAGIPDPVEFIVDFTAGPQPLAPQKAAVLDFAIRDPWKNRPVKKFVEVHEKLLHAFIVSGDLEFFEHAHPTFNSDQFECPVTFPKAGMFRILTDFYPEGATPQLITKTVFVPGENPAPVKLQRDYSAKRAKNLSVSLETTPPQPVVGQRTQLRFTLDTADGLEKYLGAWAHMLAASDDVIDMMHQHPFVADGGPKMQFNLIFPRARAYRVWVQFQRNGIVNTAHFDIPVEPAPASSEGISGTGAN